MDMGPMGKYQFMKASGDRFPVSGLWKATPDMPMSAWRFYFRVPDIDAAVSTINAEGGQVCQDPIEIPGVELSINGSDPQGAAFGLVGPRK